MMEKIPSELLTVLISAFGVLLSGLFSWLTKAIVDFYAAKTQKEKGDKDLDELTRYLEIASEAVKNGVATVLVDYVEKVKGTEEWEEHGKEVSEQMALVLTENQLGPDIIRKITAYLNPDGVTIKTFSDWAQPRIATALEQARAEVANRKALEQSVSQDDDKKQHVGF